VRGLICGIFSFLLLSACGGEEPVLDLGTDAGARAVDITPAPPPLEPPEPVVASPLPPREVPPPWLPDEDPWDPEGLLGVRPLPEPPPCEVCGGRP
jgi:hypothetical protein